MQITWSNNLTSNKNDVSKKIMFDPSLMPNWQRQLIVAPLRCSILGYVSNPVIWKEDNKMIHVEYDSYPSASEKKKQKKTQYLDR